MSKYKQKMLIIFDGSNFYHSLKKLDAKHTLDFNYSSFLKWLVNSPKYISRYNVGEIKYNPLDVKSKKLFAGQRKLFAKLKQHQIEIVKGYMLKSDGKYHEKGVDVQIALDIAIGAYENTYDTCFLISSDTDLIPAIKKAKSLGKKIIYVGFGKALSHAMQHNCSSTKIVTKQDLAQFVK